MNPATTAPMPMVRQIGVRTFDFGREVAVAAIINRTPDSFYDRGANYQLGEALATADRAVEEGADWLDVGGVKAAPGPEVPLAEELDRVLPLIEALRARTGAVISIDTFRSEVARRGRGHRPVRAERPRHGRCRRRGGRWPGGHAQRRPAPHPRPPPGLHRRGRGGDHLPEGADRAGAPAQRRRRRPRGPPHRIDPRLASSRRPSPGPGVISGWRAPD